MSAFTLGIDFGTNSVRALVVDCLSGREVSTAATDYPSGHQGILLDKTNVHLARQSPEDYLFGLKASVREALRLAGGYEGFALEKVVGIGVDTTGSSPIPVDVNNRPLGLDPKWKNNLHAQCWLWKDHTSHEEATTINRLASEHRPHYLVKCGNTYSSEWWWSKIWHCLRVDRAVFEAAYSWVELSDYIPSELAGIRDPRKIVRGVCAAGHKALYADQWGGLPDKEFLALLDPALASLRERLYGKAYDASHRAGVLCREWADALGLPEGIPIAIGEMDVHYGAIGCGVEEGTLVKVIGTSTCDCAVVSVEKDVADIPGICGIVNGSILPGYFGIEAGQSAVGDLFKWWVETVFHGDASYHARFTDMAASERPGASGLLALDWNNGNRSILVDQRLTGLLIGQTLHTTPGQIYRALIEATAFGARMILERIKDSGVPVKRIVCAGGIAEKNPLLMQIYADVTRSEMRVSASSQACALGAAIAAAVVSGIYPDFKSAQTVMVSLKDLVYRPDPGTCAVYDQLFILYRQVHDAFGGVTREADLSSIMKELLKIKESTLS